MTKNNTRLIVVLFPAREQIRPEHVKKMLAYNGSDENHKLDLLAPNRVMRRMAENLDLEFYDMYDHIKKNCPEINCYFKITDPHFNKKGQEAVATYLFKRLQPGIDPRDK